MGYKTVNYAKLKQDFRWNMVIPNKAYLQQEGERDTTYSTTFCLSLTGISKGCIVQLFGVVLIIIPIPTLFIHVPCSTRVSSLQISAHLIWDNNKDYLLIMKYNIVCLITSWHDHLWSLHVLTAHCKSSSGDEVDWLQITDYSTMLLLWLATFW